MCKALLIVCAVLILVPAMAQAQKNTEESAAVRFVRNEYYHGVPWVGARRFGRSDIPSLARLLEDPAEKPHWANVVWVLGVIGDSEAEERLITFQERFEGTIDHQTFNALLQVNLALGLAATDPNSRAFQYLTEAGTPESWGKRVKWNVPGISPLERNVLLLQLAINGLGLTGRAEADEELLELQRRLGPEILEVCRPNIEEALERNRLIRKLGRDEYFGKYSARQ